MPQVKGKQKLTTDGGVSGSPSNTKRTRTAALETVKSPFKDQSARMLFPIPHLVYSSNLSRCSLLKATAYPMPRARLRVRIEASALQAS